MSTANPYQPPSGARPGPPPPPTGPQPGTSLDFGRTLSFMFKDPDWVRKFLIGSLFALLSVFLIGGIFLTGYLMRLIRNAARGVAHPLPEWDDLGGMFVEGLIALGAYLAYVLPPVGAFVLIAIGLGVGSHGGRAGELAAASGFVLLALALGLVLLALLVYLPAAFTRLAIEQRFSAAFELEENFGLIKRNVANYLMAIVAYILANFIAQFSILLLCIGIFAGIFWQQCVVGYALGEVVLRDPGSRAA